MTGVVRVDKCVAVHWCGVVVVTLRRVVTAKKGEEAKTGKASDVGGTHGAKRRSFHNTTRGRAVSATSSAGSATSHMNRPLDGSDDQNLSSTGAQRCSFRHQRLALMIAVVDFK